MIVWIQVQLALHKLGIDEDVGIYVVHKLDSWTVNIGYFTFDLFGPNIGELIQQYTFNVEQYNFVIPHCVIRYHMSCKHKTNLKHATSIY